MKTREARFHGTGWKSRAIETSIRSPGEARTRSASSERGASGIQPERRAEPRRRTQYQRRPAGASPVTWENLGRTELAGCASRRDPGRLRVEQDLTERPHTGGSGWRPVVCLHHLTMLAFSVPGLSRRLLRARAMLAPSVVGGLTAISAPVWSQPASNPPPERVLTVTLADLDDDAFDFLIGWARGDGDILELAARGTARFALVGGLEPGLRVLGGAVRYRESVTSSVRARLRAEPRRSRGSARRASAVRSASDAARRALRDAARRKARDGRAASRPPRGWRGTPRSGNGSGRSMPPPTLRGGGEATSGGRARPRAPRGVGAGSRAPRSSAPRPRGSGSSRRRPG